MLLNARKVFYEGNPHTTLLLGIEDVTERHALEREGKNYFAAEGRCCCERRICCLRNWNTGLPTACKSLR